MIFMAGALLIGAIHLNDHTPIDTSYLSANNDSLFLTTYNQQIPKFYQCDFLGRCRSDVGKHHPYKVDVSLADERSTLSLKIRSNNQLSVYPYGKFDHELHRLSTSHLLLVSEDADNTGTYTRAFYVKGHEGQEIDFIKGTSFSQDDIRLAETGVLRLYYQDFGAPASGVFFDEFSTATRWYYPINFTATGCDKPFIYAFTADQHADIYIVYDCDVTPAQSKSTELHINIRRLASTTRTKSDVLTHPYWLQK